MLAGAWVCGWPQAEESRRCRDRTEDDGVREARLQQAGLAGSPGDDVIDFERHADAEQQGDDVCEIGLRSDRDAERLIVEKDNSRTADLSTNRTCSTSFGRRGVEGANPATPTKKHLNIRYACQR